MNYNKITVGYVTQSFVNGVCVSQEFIAGEAQYETVDGEEIEIALPDADILRSHRHFRRQVRVQRDADLSFIAHNPFLSLA